MKSIAFILAFSLPMIIEAQTLPFSSITAYPDNYTAGTVAARAVDGLGFRFYWATDGLREADMIYKPSGDARTCQETIEHIYEMSFLIANASLKKMNANGQNVKLSFSEMRKKTLENFKIARDILYKSSDEEMKNFKVLFNDGKKNV